MLVLRWIVNALALWIVSVLVAGIHADSVFATLVAALVLGVLNALVRPILLLLTLPINVMTLGLFTFVVNALMLELTASVVKGFYVDGFGSALVGALLLSIVSFVLSLFVGGRRVHIEVRRGY